MDTNSNPIPKPRTGLIQDDPLKRPVPLPRTKVPINNDRVSASEIFRSIGTVSKQITEDVTHKVTSSAKTANEKIEKSLIDGSRFAKDTLEKTINTSRAVRNSVTKSVIEHTKNAGLKLRRSKVTEDNIEENPRCVSMPVVDVSLFDNIQFHSPLLEQKKFNNKNIHDEMETPISLQLNNTNFDEMSVFSSNSNSVTGSVSNISHESQEFEQSDLNSNYETDVTYDTPRSSRVNSFSSVRSAPEIPNRRKKRDVETMRQNSLYENWTLPHQPLINDNIEATERPSKSTIYEFDPLNCSSTTKKYEGLSNELLLLESFLVGDTYGTIVANNFGIEEVFDFVESDYFNPPMPPERLDSLTTAETTAKSTLEKSVNNSSSNWYVGNNIKSIDTEDDVKSSSSVIQKFSNILKLDSVLNKNVKPTVPKVNTVERPQIHNLPVTHHSGILSKVVSGVVEDFFKNSQSRYCILSDQKLMCYLDAANSVVKEVFMLDNVNSIQIVLPLSSSNANNTYCFELMISTSIKSAPRKVLFGCNSASERRNWGQKIVEHLTSGFPTKYTSEFTRCGWCYLKEGVSGDWRGAWVMLVRRVLVYYTTPEQLCTVDLRKTRCVVVQDADEDTKRRCPSDNSPNLLLDCPHATLYLRFPCERELKGWRYMVKLAAHNNGSYLHHQQLTKEDVPAIVDKCISFIYAHGSLSEGIYRRAGSSSVLSELLGRFRRDAWSVVLIPGQHSEHDVAGVLKRFFRDLPESLMPQEYHQRLISALEIKDIKQRNKEYRELMGSLPIVSRHTARKLFAHLHFLNTMAHANKMNAENLASVWAPTIMPAALTSQTLQTAWSAKEQYVVRDMISNYEDIWEPTEVETRREAAIRRILMRVLSNTAPTSPKAAGDLRAWVYIHDRNTCHQIALTPNKTSADVCIELCEKAGTDSHLLMLQEVICNESMSRIIHVDDIVLDVVLRWGYWDEEDRKDNYLIVKQNKVLYDMEALKSTVGSICGELKVANEATKAFKLHMFECSNYKLCYFKDKQGSRKIEEWNIKDILWYVGHEPKRNPQSRWAITFIPKNNKQKRSRDRPWFGTTIAGAVTEDQLKWMAALMFAEHSNIIPTPRLVIT
ncbi:arf-GAP with Rho-GAP domain, ANK repeat and PH domain-containing protein 2 [Leptidea sinapis]|uniref:arf-GAP with Rho-GAP domain, ANK repeat and PH domain-containing protein 2 n=1 Tax=Leptidea sinapis TaxID=189913 RepID=UPI00213FC5A6|nr:arf-GAP with Rho-GAP domain, ANK repeat and PH domain-containing protein 2 [Leptidea sinapis]